MIGNCPKNARGNVQRKVFGGIVRGEKVRRECSDFGSTCMITSLYLLRLWFVPPWLTPTDRQTAFDHTISSQARTKEGGTAPYFRKAEDLKNSFTLIVSVCACVYTGLALGTFKFPSLSVRRHVYFTAAGGQALDLPANLISPPFSWRISDVLLFDSFLCGQPFSLAFQIPPIPDFGISELYFHATYVVRKVRLRGNLITPRYSISRRTKDSHPKRFFAQFRPISALGYPKYGTPISVVGHPSLQSVQWLNMFGMWHYTQISSLHRMVEKRQHVFHQGVSCIVCRFSTTGAQIWPPISSPKRCFLCGKRASEL